MTERGRYLGQHFLKNQAAIEKIVAALDLWAGPASPKRVEAGDTVVEIGPGHGELTNRLIASPVGKIIAIEKDINLGRQLRSIFRIADGQVLNVNIGSSDIPKLTVVDGDVLKILPELSYKLSAKSYKLVGNIPYYITGYLFRVIGELEHKPSLIVLTIQKEVAERLCAEPPRMNSLAASVQIWAEPEIVGILPPSYFEPPPKVESAIIRLNIRSSNDQWSFDDQTLNHYYRLIKIIFKQPRKTILNNLAEGFQLSKNEVVEKLKKLGLTGQERGQDLSIERLVALTKIF